ncbi:endo-1,3;1,4-beta-D-glucanase-like [Dioscorea cayenensis subsp. rotundata]|uniref:Endo-1,31,4-beta-D-glucanase-like n=1 Tax=Dioscorea cayennensis subsp. rotundata TaxID=55577 RepID=A0AB40BTI5_DIOCR|nr:endo-1,3;1,4-beta-D-glucanase-like [Dioscorea cayenensis subsp. rotundata]
MEGRAMANPQSQSQCCENPPTLNPSSGHGSVVENLGGLKAYTAGSPESKLAVLLVSDVYGFEAPNLRKLADKVAAAAGYFVVVPDFLHGDPYVPEKVPFPTWLQAHGAAKGFEEAKHIVEALKSTGTSAIGAAGFCWGAKVVAELAKSEDIKAAVMLHPSFVTVEDIKEIKVSLAVLGAEIDRTSPPSLLKEFEKILSTKSEVDSFVKIFPGVAHGWTVRYDVHDEAVVKSAEEAHQNMLEWFSKYLK